MRNLQPTILLAIILLSAIPTLANAQTLPSAAQPSRVGGDDLAPGSPRTTAPLVEQPQAESAMPGMSGEEAKKYIFTFSAINFEGNTVYHTEEFKPLYENMLGQKVSLQDMIKVADQITAKYHAAGYSLSRAIVPPQTIKNGIVNIQIIEGFIDKVSLQGPGAATNPQLQAYARKIEAARPYNAQDAERYLLLAGDLPGITLRDILVPSKTTQGADTLVMIVEDRTPLAGEATIDNLSSRYLGPFEAKASASVSNVLNLNEQLSVQAIRALNEDQLSYGAANFNMPIGDQGTRAGVQVSATTTHPGFNLSSLNVVGQASTWDFNITHPLLRLRDQNLQLNAHFGQEESREKQDDVSIGHDRLSVLRGGADYQITDDWRGTNAIGGSVSQGLDILGARETGSPDLSRTGGHSDFTKFNASASRLQKITPDVNFLVAASGQLANNPLLTAEQFGLGGSEFLRGYDNSDVVGDDGYAGKTELQYNVITGQPYLDLAQIYGFWDIGQVHYQDPVPTGIKQNESLASAGFGARFRFTSHLNGFAELAQPLTHASPSDVHNDPRVYAGLTVNF